MNWSEAVFYLLMLAIVGGALDGLYGLIKHYIDRKYDAKQAQPTGEPDR